MRELAQLRQVVFSILALSSTLLAEKARGAERPYAFVQGVESLPQGELELEDWFGASRPQSGAASWEWWVGPVVGITDRLEAGLFGILLQPPAPDGTPGSLQLDSLRLQISYALADRGSWPIDVRVRLEVGVPAADDSLTGWASIFASRDIGRLNVTANLVTSVEVAKVNAAVFPYLNYALGTSYAIVGAFRAGGEFFGQKDFTGDESWVVLGPSVAYGIGRLWLAASYGFGLTSDSPRQRGRIVLGLAF